MCGVTNHMLECGQPESNRRPPLGRRAYYRYTIAARVCMPANPNMNFGLCHVCLAERRPTTSVWRPNASCTRRSTIQ